MVRSQGGLEPCVTCPHLFSDHSMASFYQEYLDALRSPDTSARRDAGVALSVLGPSVLPYLIDLLKGISGFYYEANERYASDIARAIGLTLYPEIAVPRLIEVLMTTSEPLARKETAYALRFMGPAAIDAVPALVDLLNDNEDPRTRRDAAIALGAIGVYSPAVIHRLTHLLEGGDVQSQMGGARALGMLGRHVGQSARLALAAASQSTNAAVRIRATTALAAINEDKTAAWIPSLLSWLQPTEPAATRLESALALKTAKPGSRAIDALARSLREDSDAFVRSEIALVLGGMSDCGPDVVGHLATALVKKDEDVRVKEAAAEGLRLIGPSAATALPALITALRDEDAAVRELAALALQKLGPDARAAADALRAALYDRNPAVQIRAAVALVSVAPNDPASVNHLVYLIGSNYPEVRLVGADRLRKMGKVGTAAAMQVLKAMEEETDPWVRAEAQRTIQVIDGRSTPLLTRMFPHDDQKAVDGTTNGAQTVGRDAVQGLVKALEEVALDPRHDVKFHALMALQAIDDTVYSELCVEHCRNWSDIWRRQSQPIQKLLYLKLKDDLSYEETVAKLAKLTHEFRQRVAEELAPALNARIRLPDMPHETLEQKKELARWVNEQIEPLGLAVQCPNTGLPAKLRGVTGSNRWPDVGRFCCEIYKDRKQKKTAYWDSLPELTLTDVTPQREPEVNWQQAVGPKTSRRGRKLS